MWLPNGHARERERERERERKREREYYYIEKTEYTRSSAWCSACVVACAQSE